jgi:hypothetical protein
MRDDRTGFAEMELIASNLGGPAKDHCPGFFNLQKDR